MQRPLRFVEFHHSGSRSTRGKGAVAAVGLARAYGQPVTAQRAAHNAASLGSLDQTVLINIKRTRKVKKSTCSRAREDEPRSVEVGHVSASQVRGGGSYGVRHTPHPRCRLCRRRCGRHEFRGGPYQRVRVKTIGGRASAPDGGRYRGSSTRWRRTCNTACAPRSLFGVTQGTPGGEEHQCTAPTFPTIAPAKRATKRDVSF